MIILAFLAVILAIVGIIAYMSLTWGLALYKFWGWFFLPVFPQAPDISFMQAVGLLLFFGLLTHKTSYKEPEWLKEKRTKKEKIESLVTQLIAPFVTLGVGYLVYCLFL